MPKTKQTRKKSAPRGKEKSPQPKRKKQPPKRASRESAADAGSPARSAPRRLLSFVLVCGLWLGLVAAGFVAYYAYTLPDISRARDTQAIPSISMIDVNGHRFGRYGNLFGEALPLAEMPAHLVEAVLAIEDRRFYSHFGIDVVGLARAAWQNWRAGRIVQGGSTITQQLAKNLFLTRERTLKRKIQEVLLALYLEAKLRKDQILALYLNRVYFGSGAYGVAAAADRYFGKSVSELTLNESAVLAGLLKAPSRYSPISNRDAALRRAAVVLQAMREAGFLNQVPADRSFSLIHGAANAATAPYFADWIMADLSDYVGRVDRDLNVYTTLDSELQLHADRLLTRYLERFGAEKGVTQGAIVALAPDGAIRAMVGGRSYRASQFNRVTQARRQPGSAFKPFVYLAALESGLTPDDVVIDRPVAVGEWSPRNYSGRYEGPLKVRDALAKSVNSVAVQLAERSGRGKVIDAAHRLGVLSTLHNRPSIALGTSEVTLLELTTAYAHIANGGWGVLPYGIRAVAGSNEVDVYRRQGSGLGQVVEEGQAFHLHQMLLEVIASGTGRAARFERLAAGKTGTTQGYRDAWFVGYTTDLIAGVWVGNDDGAPMNDVTGGGLPAEIWRDLMIFAMKGVPPRDFPVAGTAKAGRQSFWERFADDAGKETGERGDP